LLQVAINAESEICDTSELVRVLLKMGAKPDSKDLASSLVKTPCNKNIYEALIARGAAIEGADIEPV
jgi:hypothetical protein